MTTGIQDYYLGFMSVEIVRRITNMDTTLFIQNSKIIGAYMDDTL